MIEQKTRGSVWNIAMFAVFLFLAAISFAGIFTATDTTAVTASAVSR